jgi:hypothetical protein
MQKLGFAAPRQKRSDAGVRQANGKKFSPDQEQTSPQPISSSSTHTIPEKNVVAYHLLQKWAEDSTDHNEKIWPALEQHLIEDGAIATDQT